MAGSEVFADGALAGRAVLVTGGGTGLGRAAAAELRRCGAEVVICGRRAEVLEATAAELGAAWVAGDVRADADAERILDFALERCGRLDVLVNNAGGQYFTPAEAIEPKGWRAVTRLNVGATERMARLAAERAFGDGGTVVNVTLSPHHGFAGMAHSAAARAAVEGYTRALADEWAERGIAVVAIAAGHYDTASLRKYPEVVWRSSAATIPLQRLGPRGGARLARRALLLAAGRGALGLGRDARRRPRQLVRPLAARRPRPRGRRDPGRGAPA